MTRRPKGLLGQIRDLVSWLGEGRRLTQTDRIGLADARELVELLETGDEVDPVMFGRVEKTKSSAELRGLTELAEWAKAAALVRVVKHRLVPVKKHAKTLDDPEGLRRALFRGLASSNFAVSPDYGWRAESLLEIDYDLGFDTIVGILYIHPGVLSIHKIAEAVWDTLAPRWRLSDRSPRQMATLRKSTAADVRIVMDRLAQLGTVIVRGDNVNLTSLGRTDLARRRGEPEPGDPVLRLRVELLDVDDPTPWRRIDIAPAVTLGQLHSAIQAAMGWKNAHLHDFTTADGTRYGPEADEDSADETKTTVGEALTPGADLAYTYDFGDDWRHRVSLELETTAEADRAYPYCADGAGACPPEDCGGPPGYSHLKAALTGSAGPEQAELLDWLGLERATEFDPADFDRDLANKRLRAL